MSSPPERPDGHERAAVVATRAIALASDRHLSMREAADHLARFAHGRVTTLRLAVAHVRVTNTKREPDIAEHASVLLDAAVITLTRPRRDSQRIARRAAGM